MAKKVEINDFIMAFRKSVNFSKPIRLKIRFRLYAININPTSAFALSFVFFVIIWSNPHCRFMVPQGSPKPDNANNDSGRTTAKKRIYFFFAAV